MNCWRCSFFMILVLISLSFSKWPFLSDKLSGAANKKTKNVLLDGCGAPLTVTSVARIISSDYRGNETDATSVAGINNNTGKNETEPALFCSDAHRGAIEFCSRDGNNKVYRNDYSKDLVGWPALRPYSLSSGLQFNPPLPPCESLDDYAASIKYGQRYWPPAQQSSKETDPSVFLPHGCYAPTLPPDPSKTCQLLNQYSHVIFHGDSLSRHLRLAIYMSMRGDYARSPHVRDPQCICDGQFSEKKSCRDMDEYFEGTVEVSKIEGQGLCPGTSFRLGKKGTAPYLTRRTGKPDPWGEVDWSSARCADDSYRGMLLVAQGGLHYKMESSAVFSQFVQPMITHAKFKECLEHGKLRFVWLAAPAASLLMDRRYPHQSRSNAVTFNVQIEEMFVSSGLIPGEDVVILDWWNMTANAQTSDGMHSLTEANLARTAQILYLVERWPFPRPYGSWIGKTATSNSTAV